MIYKKFLNVADTIFWFIIVPSFLKTIAHFQQSLWPFEAKYPIFPHWRTADRNVPPIVNCYDWLKIVSDWLKCLPYNLTMYLLCVSDKIRMIRVNISKFHVDKPFNLRKEEWKTSCESIQNNTRSIVENWQQNKKRNFILPHGRLGWKKVLADNYLETVFSRLSFSKNIYRRNSPDI